MAKEELPGVLLYTPLTPNPNNPGGYGVHLVGGSVEATESWMPAKRIDPTGGDHPEATTRAPDQVVVRLTPAAPHVSEEIQVLARGEGSWEMGQAEDSFGPSKGQDFLFFWFFLNSSSF
jgi:hypothetical protein